MTDDLVARPLAWATSDGRVVPDSTMETAKSDGGATLSSLRSYTIPLSDCRPLLEQIERLRAKRHEAQAYCRRVLDSGTPNEMAVARTVLLLLSDDKP